MVPLNSPFAPLIFLAFLGVLVFIGLAGGKAMWGRILQGIGLYLGLAVLTFKIIEWSGSGMIGLAWIMLVCLGGGAYLSGCFKPFFRRGEWKSRGRRKGPAKTRSDQQQG